MSTSTGDRVDRFLVTSGMDDRMRFWITTTMYANWIEGKDNPRLGEGIETWIVTVFDYHADAFLRTAERIGVTVEKIIGAGENESYELLLGEPGTGWQG